MIQLVEEVKHTFQSALPRGERLSLLPCCRFTFCISIRSPTRGATPCVRLTEGAVLFQSTLPRGSDADLVCDVSRILISIRAPARGATMIQLVEEVKHTFQSALPQGERL